ncbi:DPY30 domain-containing protein 1 isoform X2 [Falco naumanni]|uniref:DPY30 domain-containing protein 1 isoform X2 n=1 Tax=Falco naumanni TaxID=148594 RepID=UPI001ADE9A65|nr:DPY30 domain-containing protein 1 isoform X2 [Falco naumanni]
MLMQQAAGWVRGERLPRSLSARRSDRSALMLEPDLWETTAVIKTRMLERTELEQEREAALVEVEILRKMKEEELMIQRKLEEQCQGQLEQEREELEQQNEDDKMLFQQKDQEEIGKTIAELTDKAGVPNLTRIEENEQLESITDLMAEAEQESSQLI